MLVHLGVYGFVEMRIFDLFLACLFRTQVNQTWATILRGYKGNFVPF